jgi:hypothetical protein
VVERSRGVLRKAAQIAVVAGALLSIGLMLRAGHPPVFLRILFAIWVLAPFVALLAADAVSTRWSVMTQVTLHSVMLFLSLTSLVIYGYVVVRPPKSTPAFVWVAVPVASCLLMTIVIPIAAFMSGKRR